MTLLKGFKLSTLKSKVVITTTLLTLVGALSISTLTYYQLAPQLIKAEQERALSVTDLASSSINGDIFGQIAKDRDVSSKLYRQLKSTFTKYAALMPNSSIYTLTDIGDGTYAHILDGDERVSLGYTESKDVFSKELQEAFETGEITYSPIYEDKDTGVSYVSAFRPITNSSKNVIGVIVCDYNVDSLVNKLSDVRNIALISAIILVICLLIIDSLILKHFFKPLNNLSDAMTQVAKGDLRVELQANTKDEIGHINHSLNKTVESLHKMIDNISISAKEVYSQSTIISSGAETSTNATETIASITEEVTLISREQSKNAEATSENMARVMQSVKDIYVKIDCANKVSHDTRTSTEEGIHLMVDSYNQMESISESVNHTKEIVVELANQMDIIKGIVTTISNISSQTNLLALNAAIEAARAGDQGRGFAIVADEVRRLAGASQTATEEIESIIKYLGNHTQNILESTDNNIKAVKEGQAKLTLANQTVESIQTYNVELETSMVDIRTYADSIVKQSNRINNSVSDLQREAKTVEESISNLSSLTQEQLAYSEEERGLAQSLEQSSTVLTSTISEFLLK